MSNYLSIVEDVKEKHLKHAGRTLDFGVVILEIEIVRNLHTGRKMMRVRYNYKGVENMSTIANPY